MSAVQPTNVTALPSGLPPCKRCGGSGVDVWRCSFCKQVMHVECGLGVEYRKADGPLQVLDGLPVIGAWYCTGCTTIAGLDQEDDRV